MIPLAEDKVRASRKFPPALRPYLGIFRIRFVAGMQYRAAAWAGVATQFFWGTINILVFYAFYESAGMNSGAATPMTFSQLADFVWLRQAFLALVMLWFVDNDLLETIASGDVAYELARPLSLYVFWYSRVLAYRISRTVLRCFPIFIISFILPSPWGFSLPQSVPAAVMFIFAMTMAALLATALSMIICLITFATLTPRGSMLLLAVAAEFLMGAYIPIPFMPAALQRLCYILPFRYTADFPFRIYSGNIMGIEALTGFGMQCLWLVLLIAFGAFGFRRALGRLVIQGG